MLTVLVRKSSLFCPRRRAAWFYAFGVVFEFVEKRIVYLFEFRLLYYF